MYSTPENPEFEFTDAERRVFKPREKVTVAEWAERHRMVVKGPAQGKWRNETTPYSIFPMECWNMPWVRKIWLCWAPQTSKSQTAINCLLYAIDQDPGPAMYIMPDEKVARRISRRQIRPSIMATPRTAELVGDGQDDMTTLAVSFKNGMDLMMAWATSAAALASESVKYMFLDEPGKYPDFTGREADPFSLAEVRTNAYTHTKKIMYFSTPNLDGDAFDAGFKTDTDLIYHYMARCPICKKLQKMEFENITWPSDVRDPRVVVRKKLAVYTCVNCGMEWNDAYRNQAVRLGEWVTDKDVYRPASIGFHLPSWYSPFVSLSDVVAAFLKAQSDPKKLHAFDTQHRAQAYKEVIDQKDEEKVLELRTEIPARTVPREAIALTAGIDMQKFGFWFVVRSWWLNRTSQLIDYGYLTRWEDIEFLIYNVRYDMEDGRSPMGIWRAALDTGGGKHQEEWSRTEEAYNFLRKHKGKNIIFGVKGASRPQFQRVQPRVLDKMARGNRIIPGGLEIRFLDTHQFKDLIQWRMGRGMDEDERWLLHSETGMDYAKQITAEEKRRDRRGKVEWVQIRKDNHLLDCEIYAAACADTSWLPDLKMVAASQAQAEVEKAALIEEKRQAINQDAGRDAHWLKQGGYNRPSWLNR